MLDRLANPILDRNIFFFFFICTLNNAIKKYSLCFCYTLSQAENYELKDDNEKTKKQKNSRRKQRDVQ